MLFDDDDKQAVEARHATVVAKARRSQAAVAKHTTWVTAEGLFGGGLSTGPDNTLRLPAHFTLDATVGYAFKKDSGLSGLKASLDVLNAFDNPYTIFIDNGYNGNHYENGREFVFRLAKVL